MTKTRSVPAPAFSSLIHGVLAWMALAVLAPSAIAQPQFDELSSEYLPVDSNWTKAVALGDVDGDGDLDMVFGNAGFPGQQNRLYLNDGRGSFTDATAALLPRDSNETTAVALGDVDGDGDNDLVFGNSGGLGEQNRLYLNDGTGRFIDATATHMPVGRHSTFSLALGDVDGDGDDDLVIGDNGQQNRLHVNDGNGIFTDATVASMPSDNGSSALTMGDVDGDGDPDLVLSSFAQDSLYLNDGKGTFTDATAGRMPPANGPILEAELGDVDGDGDLDLVLGTLFLQNRLYLNDGTGTFTDATAARMPPPPPRDELTMAIALGDVDGDGDTDVVFGNAHEQNRLFINDGTGTFTDVSAARMPADTDDSVAVALGDVDGDGDPDLVFGNEFPSLRNHLYLNDGTGGFTDPTIGRMPSDDDRPHAVALGDVDGDGDADLVFGNIFGQNSLYLNDGTGGFTDATAAGLPSDSGYTTAVALGDVDGDGDLDLVFGNAVARFSTSQNLLYVNDGTGTFIDATATHLPADDDPTIAVALDDVDGDGDNDLVFGNFDEQNRLYVNDGTGTFSDATASRLPTDSDSTRAVALGDVDGDGDNDLVFGNGSFAAGRQTRLYLNDGAGTFTNATAARLPPVGNETFAVALGDVEGDGDLDLVLGTHGKQNRLYVNNGTGTFTDATAARMPPNISATRAVALGDVDGDGDLDLVVGNEREQNRRYLNDGTGTFTDATRDRMPVDDDETTAVALGDVDGDGDPDIVLANADNGQNRLYVNLHRQIDSPLLPVLSRTFAVDFHARPGYGASFHTAIPALSFGLSATSLPVPPLGDLYLDLNGVINLPWVAIPPSAGKGTLEVTVPADPSLVGRTVYVQGLIVNNAQPYGDSHLTGYTADVIIR